RTGSAKAFDWGSLAGDTVPLGLNHRPWEGRWAPAIRGVSPAFTASHFDPGAWKPNIPVAPFDGSDRFDQFWAAKIIARFTPEQIRAAVEAVRYSDPRAGDYNTNTLLPPQPAGLSHSVPAATSLLNRTPDDSGAGIDE